MLISKVSNDSVLHTSSFVKKVAAPITLISGGLTVSQFEKGNLYKNEKLKESSNLSKSINNSVNKISSISQSVNEKINTISNISKDINTTLEKGFNGILTPKHNLKVFQELNSETVNKLMHAKSKNGKIVFNQNGIDALDKVRKNCEPAYNYILANAEYIDKIKNINSTLFSSKNGIYAHAVKEDTDISLNYSQHILKDKSYFKGSELNIKEFDKKNNVLTEYKYFENEFGDFIEIKKTYDMSKKAPNLTDFKKTSGNKNL